MSDSLVLAVLLAHAAATWFMTGLSWTIHAVHYPLFATVGENFVAYESEHGRRISTLVAVPWSVECLTALSLPVIVGDRVPLWLPITGLALVGVLLGSTMLLQVPAHRLLGQGFNPAAHRRLLRTDRIRVAAWSARSVLAIWMVAVALDVGPG